MKKEDKNDALGGIIEIVSLISDGAVLLYYCNYIICGDSTDSNHILFEELIK